MRRRLALASFGAALIGAEAFACSAPNIHLHLESLTAEQTRAQARAMVAAAARVEVLTPVSSRKSPANSLGAAEIIRFRVAESLKGASAAPVELAVGTLTDDDGRPQPTPWLYREKGTGRVSTFGIPRLTNPPHPCPHYARVERGARYVVFRDAKGRPSGALWFMPVAQGGPDPWLAAVREAARVRRALR